MSTYNSKIKISSIVYDSSDANVLINAVSIKNHLSFESQLIVSFSELNRLLNQLQKQNPMISVSELFQEERLDQHFSQFFLDGEQINNNTLMIDHFVLDSVKKQIRA